MKKVKLISLFYFMLLSNLCLSQTGAMGLKMFAIDELKEDYTYWRNRIEEKHPLVYFYTSKNQIDECFDSLYQQINCPMTDFIKILAPVMALIQDGHNYVIPTETALASIRNYSYLFPFELKYIDERLYIIQDLSTSEEPLTGLEITSINSVGSKDMGTSKNLS